MHKSMEQHVQHSRRLPRKLLVCSVYEYKIYDLYKKKKNDYMQSNTSFLILFYILYIIFTYLKFTLLF